MQRNIVSLPDSLKPIVFNWDIDWRGQPSQDNTAGFSQVVFNQFPRWVGEPAYFVTPDELGTWRATRALVQGRKNVYRVCLKDVVSSNAYPTETSKVPWSNAQPWSNSQNWFSSYGSATGFEIQSTGDFPVGSTTITVKVPGAVASPQVGQIMSHEYWPFVVTSVTQTGVGLFTLDIQMGLRAPMSHGDDILWEGCGLFEAVTDRTGNPSYNNVGFSRPEFQLREWINR